MTNQTRRTIVVHGRQAMREVRLKAARDRDHGLQIMSFEQLAVRLAGGFTRPIDGEALRASIQAVLPATELGELESIKMLPGMIDASAETLHKAWRAGMDLASRAKEHPRLDSVARLEAAVLAELPAGMMRPADLVAAAIPRLKHAAAILGPVEIVGITELSPCWRPLLRALRHHILVTWTAGPRTTPAWLADSGIAITRTTAETPAIQATSAATAYHEAIEAIRWARELLVSGAALPSDIAIAAASPTEYDAYFLPLRDDANLEVHFVHGIGVASTRDGQAAAALADILIRGLSQARLRRLYALCGAISNAFRDLPPGWTRILPTDAPLSSMPAWTRLLDRLTAADWPDGEDRSSQLRTIVEQLAKGTGAAEESGRAFLAGRSLAIWRKALLAGPPSSLDATLERLRQDDDLDAAGCVSWMPASALAASPRKFVRLLGLNSSRWPRNVSDDRLISDHIVPTNELDPLPVGAADRRDFETILATTAEQIVLSRARRDGEGRLLGRSPLVAAYTHEKYVRRNQIPTHAYSESDRLMARPQDFARESQAIGATACWRNWNRKDVTPHDGLIRGGHPLISAILERTQSASSLRLLLRNPLAYVWRYGMHLRSPENLADPLILDPIDAGSLIHMILDLALQKLQARGGLASAGEKQVAATVDAAADEVGRTWEAERGTPPALMWRRTLDDSRALTLRALLHGDDLSPDRVSYGEVAFGGASPKSASAPWDPQKVVDVPGTDFRINGYIDRLDISGDRLHALVRDYKTGRPPKDDIVIDGGRELQRCLYAFAVKALLGGDVSIRASLLFPREQIDLQLADPDATLSQMTGHLRAARTNLVAGNALIGPDAGGDFDDFALALPAMANATYRKRKSSAIAESFGEAAKVWEAR